MAAAVIPSLDFSKAKTHRQELASQLTRALEGVGFPYIDNVEGFDPDELLRDTKWFFSLPLEERLATAPKQWNPASKNTYRGYFPIVPGRVDNKEGLEIYRIGSPSRRSLLESWLHGLREQPMARGRR